jgi:hypothetical protein
MPPTAIPESLTFSTAGREAPAREQVEIDFDGQILIAHRPKDAVLAMLTTAVSRRANTGDLMLALTEFLDKVLDDASAEYLNGRLDDPEDPLDLGDAAALMEALVAHWAAQMAPASRAQRRAKPKRA